MRSVLLRLALLLILSLVPAHGLSRWDPAAPSPSSSLLRDVIFAEGVWVAAGDTGAILTSSDAVDWTARPSGTFATIRSLAHGNGRFVAVGEQFNLGIVLRSDDGVHWTTSTNITEPFLDVVFAKGVFVAVGPRWTNYVSTDGIHWTAHPSGDRYGKESIAYGNGRFLTWGALLATSENGLDWAKHRDNGPSVPGKLTFANGIFLLAKHLDLLSTTDGTDIEPRPEFASPRPVVVQALPSAAGDWFFASKLDGTIWKSVDGKQWSAMGMLPTPQVYATASNGDTIAVVGKGIFVSREGAPFVEVLERAQIEFWGVQWLNGTWVAVGKQDTNALVAFSSDTIEWTRTMPQQTPELHGIDFGNNLYAAVGRYGTIITSTNLLDWTQAASPTTNRLTDVVYGGNGFVGVGALSTVVRSSDGVAWTQTSLPFETNLSAVAYGNGKYVIAGHATFHSPDGITWDEAGTNLLFTDIVYADGRFVGVAGNRFGVSTDAESWTVKTMRIPIFNGPFSGVTEVIHGCAGYTAAGFGLIGTSPDGVNWWFYPPPVANFMGIAYGDGRYLGIGSPGVIAVNLCDQAPGIQTTGLTNGRLGYTFTGRRDRRYRIETTTSLSNGSWQEVGSDLAPGAPLSHETTERQQYFRVRD